MLARALRRPAHHLGHRLEHDHCFVDRPVLVALVERQRPAHHRLHDREVGGVLGAVERHRDRRAPRRRGPVDQRKLLLRETGGRAVGPEHQRPGDPRMPPLEPAQPVPPGPEVEFERPLAHRGRPLAIGGVERIGGALNVGVGVLGEAAAAGKQQPLVLRNRLKQRLHHLETKRNGSAHQLGIVVGGEDVGARGERVRHLADRELPDGAASAGERRRQNEEGRPCARGSPTGGRSGPGGGQGGNRADRGGGRAVLRDERMPERGGAFRANETEASLR